MVPLLGRPLQELLQRVGVLSLNHLQPFFGLFGLFAVLGSDAGEPVAEGGFGALRNE
jgi:hypothetical protein